MSVQARLRERLAGEWLVAESRPGARGPAAESLFALGNGYLGVRGTPEEGAPVHDAGAILNGLHETWPIVYPEDAFGLARTGQTIVNAPDASIVRLSVDDEPFELATARLVRFERVLDMRAGMLRREVEFETARGRRILVRSSRLVSLDDRHLMAIGYEVTALDGDAAITLSSEIVTHGPAAAADDPRRGKGFAEKVLVPLAAQSLGAARCCTSAPATAGSRSRAASSTAPRRPAARSWRRPPRATPPRSSCSPTSGRASRCGSRSTSPTTGPRSRRPATCPRG
jgi:alpha,alpha-trehalose phosphorylase